MLAPSDPPASQPSYPTLLPGVVAHELALPLFLLREMPHCFTSSWGCSIPWHCIQFRAGLDDTVRNGSE